jgi:hypothetical protein
VFIWCHHLHAKRTQTIHELLSDGPEADDAYCLPA